MLAGASDLLEGRAAEVRRASLGLSAVLFISSLVRLGIGAAASNATVMETSAAMALAALTVLLLAPDATGQDRAWGARRVAGTVLAVVLVGIWAMHLPMLAGNPLAHLAPKTASCLLFLGLSLAFKPWWPKTAAGFDLLVAFVGYTVLLDLVFGIPAANAGQQPMRWEAAVAVLALSLGWLALHPRRRPAAFFFEPGSASVIMRRTLPLTLLFPLVLVVAAASRQNDKLISTKVYTAVFLLGSVAFIVALMWMISRSLDRMDTVRAAGEQEVRASEDRYRLLFESSPNPVWIYDAATLRFLAVNDSACRVYGYSREEFLAMDLLQICAPDEEPADMITGLWRHRTMAGVALDVEVFSHRVRWGGREAQVAFMHDLTARRATEAQVHTLLESTTEGIFATDVAGACIWSNPAAEGLLGYRGEHTILGRDVTELLHTDDAGAAAELVAALRAGGTFTRTEMPLRRPDGSAFPADIRCSPLRSEGRLRGAVITFDDVSERRNLQNQFNQAQKMEAVGRLAAGVAHDFNNLLTVINGYTEMLLRRRQQPALPAEVEAKLANIQKAGNRAAALTRQLLAFSRLQVMEPKVLDMNAVLREMEPLLHRVLGEDLQLRIALAPDLASVRADPSQIDQVLMNLAVNARDAMPNGGRLTIESANVELDKNYVATHPEAKAGPHVMLAITDNGAGMDHATLARAFEPFFTTKPKGQGTGLGLSTVFGIVKQSGGSVAIYSEVGRGTSVKVYLPAMAAGAAEEAAAPEGESVTVKQARVLVVEDEASVRDLVREVLAEAGYHAFIAAEPAEAIAICARETQPFDLLLTDVIMPGMDGRQLASLLGTSRPQMAVLYISGYPQQAISHNGDLDAGLAFLQKPFTPEALLRRVRQVLNESNTFGASAS